MNRELEEALKELALEIAQAYATIEQQKAVMRQALDGFERMHIECHMVSHRKGEFHASDEPCPVVAGIEATVTELREALED